MILFTVGALTPTASAIARWLIPLSRSFRTQAARSSRDKCRQHGPWACMEEKSAQDALSAEAWATMTEKTMVAAKFRNFDISINRNRPQPRS
jgi:hypothetical protein